MIFRKIVRFGIGSSLLALAACSGKSPQAGNQAATQTTSTRQSVMSPEKPPVKATVPPPGSVGQPERIPPGSCRLVAKVISVLPDLEPDKTTPCGQVPCRAVVQIINILGYGSAFGQPLAQGQEIKVYFHFTLGPTARFFPELTTPLPGLRPGSVFRADVTKAGDGAPGKTAVFQVYSYTVNK